ncbi:hypothetical protein [Nitratidesulfovibrio vulgaris]|jgi:hypothetical protein|uniref:Uncharacterized protein n=1 Tax=Nitratidesulfovibrio vulgaris (strain ATCC 29579 / DSM 644 / CCUG 34227 / NCIMB 8303 / VKM B-1760 / Hildenborough) TaxID=882 RepID=Q72CQ8_NITV2|nr:hypothetical protein [Nitratidesulfovibrio vulgaris]AAS95703.1 hypothetical protein DVU_1225 [Nitratidesulfovibrio vulgaris str. Hildenborough]ADP86292.1 hypothetical protein Deval_1131 [Nitratidesulfovibrio vulgaris RCH1]WCB47785.1 hypothetical protein PH214_06795 [Nitratidesulfovibrio vulgaris]
MDDKTLHAHLASTVLRRFDEDPARRQEALQEFMEVTLPTIDGQSADKVATLVPELPYSLYEKWATLFADRLLETVERTQLASLCDGSADNDATIALVYVMFMESERMEKQVAEDLAALGVRMADADATGNALGAYLRAKLSRQHDPTPRQ